MYKVNIDPLSKRVTSYTKLYQDSVVYNDDIVVPNDKIKDVTYETIYKDGNFERSESTVNKLEWELFQEELLSLTSETEHEHFMRLVVDELNSIEEARKKIVDRRNRITQLEENIRNSKEKYKHQIKKYYLNKDKENDSNLSTIYYSAVIMVIKHENRYLKEWIDWHLDIGFDHIYLYDNGIEEKVTEITSAYSDEVRGKITVIDWCEHHEHLQQNAYEHFMENFKQDVRWGIFIDSDEFVRFTDNTLTKVNDFLKNYEDYTEIWGYEVEYDANGQETYEDKPVRERFTRQTDVREGFYWKNFVQPNRISGWLMHYAQYNSDKHFLFKNESKNQDLFVIDHYYTKSWEEWQWKIKDRGGADPKYHKELKEFFVYNPDMVYLNNGQNVLQKYE